VPEAPHGRVCGRLAQISSILSRHCPIWKISETTDTARVLCSSTPSRRSSEIRLAGVGDGGGRRRRWRRPAASTTSCGGSNLGDRLTLNYAPLPICPHRQPAFALRCSAFFVDFFPCDGRVFRVVLCGWRVPSIVNLRDRAWSPFVCVAMCRRTRHDSGCHKIFVFGALCRLVQALLTADPLVVSWVLCFGLVDVSLQGGGFLGWLQTILLRILFAFGPARTRIPAHETWWVSAPLHVFFDYVLAVGVCFGSTRCVGLLRPPPATPLAGHLVWRRHVGRSPSHHALRATCMELLPLVEMFCKYELQEDCSNLGALMLRFDFEAQLQTHVLGRALLLMLRDDDAGLEMSSRRMQFQAPLDPFEVIRSKLAAVDTAFQTLQPQVHLGVVCSGACPVAETAMAVFAMVVYMFVAVWSANTLKCKKLGSESTSVAFFSVPSVSVFFFLLCLCLRL
jgi:hypothetical protein